jgi:hypothetical protein
VLQFGSYSWFKNGCLGWLYSVLFPLCRCSDFRLVKHKYLLVKYIWGCVIIRYWHRCLRYHKKIVGGRTTYGTLSPERTPFQIGINGKSHLWKVPGERWISHTYPMQLWAHSLLKIPSPGPVFYGTRWLPRRPCKILNSHQSVGLLEGWNRGGCTIDLCKVAVQGRSRPTLIHLFIHSFIITNLLDCIFNTQWILQASHWRFRWTHKTFLM